MRKLFAVIIIFISYQAIAQDHVSPLEYNPKLVYSTAKGAHSQPGNKYKNFIIAEDSTVLVESDTLSLPFVDDFTYPTLKPYHYSAYIYDTVYNAIGPCDTSFAIGLVTDSLSFSPTYTYTFDTATKTKDSIENTPIMFFNTHGFTGDCFNMGDTAYLYPRSFIVVFDSATGRITSQRYDTNNVLVAITYAPILYKSKAPTYTKWLDNNVYQNYTSAYLPPTIGVVTFDGLNSQGLPYNKTAPTNFGIADYLTSKPINLEGLTGGDSVYLSFFYQPGGFGYDPPVGDSLVLQFYNGSTNKWDEIWSVTGDSVLTGPTDIPDAFRQIFIQLPGNTISPPIKYFFNGFQFRFLNYGPLTGGVDIWNLDYVRLGKNRTVTDTSINDVAFQYQFPSILKNFSEMPAEQFTGTADLADTVALYIDNLNPTQATNNPPATPFTTIANETFPNPSIVMAPVINTFNAGLENTVYLYPSTQYIPPVIGSDTLMVIHSQSALNNPDILSANDTISHDQVFYNTLAYDDGTAELAYGLQNLGTNTFAYDYTLNQPDTLVGFQVLYGNVSIDVSTLVFEFELWYHLDTGNVFYTDTPVYSSNNFVAHYIDSVNGFTTYRIPPIALPTHFYFGWTQTDVNNLQIGYDMNSTKGRPHMYVKLSADGFWKLSQIASNGSPMIRLLLGHSYQIASGIKDISVNTVKVYPNPTTGVLTFDLLDASSTYSTQLYNILGQVSYNETISNTKNTVNISNLEQGIYILRMTDNKTGIVYQNKIVKSGKE